MWTEKDVIAMVSGYPDMPKVEQIFKYGDSGVVGIVVDGTERCVTGIDPEELEDTTYLVWLIGKLPNGDWLVQLDADAVCTAPEDSFRDVGPATELWAEFEAKYDHYEQEMLEWAAEADDAWEDDEE